MIICDGFLDAAHAAIEARPDRVICFFVGGGTHSHARPVRFAADAGERWVELSNQSWVPVVATVWPAGLIEPMLDWVPRQNFPPAFTADDEICGRFLRSVGQFALATVPSLVEHPDTEPSLVRRQITGGLDPSRRAAVWVEDLGFCDGRQIDWG